MCYLLALKAQGDIFSIVSTKNAEKIAEKACYGI